MNFRDYTSYANLRMSVQNADKLLGKLNQVINNYINNYRR